MNEPTQSNFSFLTALNIFSWISQIFSYFRNLTTNTLRDRPSISIVRHLQNLLDTHV